MGETAKQTYDILYRQLENYARRQGHEEHSKDFAQWVVLQIYDGKKIVHYDDKGKLKHRAFYYLLTDYLRSNVRNLRNFKGTYNKSFSLIDPDRYTDKKSDGMSPKDYADFSNHFPTVVPDLDLRLDIQKAISLLTKRQREIFTLYFDKGYSLIEVGRHFDGRSEAWASVEIKGIIALLKTHLGEII